MNLRFEISDFRISQESAKVAEENKERDSCDRIAALSSGRTG
jgi:hypothetical protein